MTTTIPATRNDLIAVSLMALHARLHSAEVTAGGAIIAVAARNQNLAIGHLLDLGSLLPECDALYRTIILLHREGETASAKGVAA